MLMCTWCLRLQKEQKLFINYISAGEVWGVFTAVQYLCKNTLQCNCTHLGLVCMNA